MLVKDGQGSVLVGQIRGIYASIPPWENPARYDRHHDPDWLEFGHVSFFDSKGPNTNLCDAPQISKAVKPSPTGDLCLLSEILPCQPGLVQHNRRANWWQVLHRNVDFWKT